MNELRHYGVKGMKWGVRRAARKERNASYRKAHESLQRDLKKLHADGKGNDNDAVIKRAAQYDAERNAAKAKYKERTARINKAMKKLSTVDVRELDSDLKKHTTGKRVVLEMLDERTGKKTGTVTALESKYTEAELRKLEREAIRKGNYRKIDVSNW